MSGAVSERGAVAEHARRPVIHRSPAPVGPGGPTSSPLAELAPERLEPVVPLASHLGHP
jgi:hypothetical protein